MAFTQENDLSVGLTEDVFKFMATADELTCLELVQGKACWHDTAEESISLARLSLF